MLSVFLCNRKSEECPEGVPRRQPVAQHWTKTGVKTRSDCGGRTRRGRRAGAGRVTCTSAKRTRSTGARERKRKGLLGGVVTYWSVINYPQV